MSMSKTTAEKIELQREKMEQMENELRRLLRQQKEEDRKKRTRRICQRGGLIESLLPDTIALSEARFRAFIEKTAANDFGRRALAALKAEQEKEDAKNGAAIPGQGDVPPVGKPAEALQRAEKTEEAPTTEPPRNVGASVSAKAPDTARQAG